MLPATRAHRFGRIVLLSSLAAGSLAIGPLHTYTLDDIPRAHADLEHNRVFGKLVGVIAPANATATPNA